MLFHERTNHESYTCEILYGRRDYEHSTPTNSVWNISVYGTNKHKHDRAKAT
jgi:hypothetical protein